MGKPDIESWLASTENMDSSDRDDDRSGALLDKARDDWPSFMELARSQLLSGKTKERIFFMEHVMTHIARHSGAKSYCIRKFLLTLVLVHRYTSVKCIATLPFTVLDLSAIH